MTEFEDNLWLEVVREHGDDLARVDLTATRSTRRSRPRLLTAGGAVIAVAAGATAILLSSAPGGHHPGHPVFAVGHGPNGAMTATFVDQTTPTPAEVAGFNKALAAIGTHTGRPADTLVLTSTGLDVRCPNGQLISTSSSTGSHGTVYSWTCPGASGQSSQKAAPAATGTD